MRIVIRVFPGAANSTAPLSPWLKSYSLFISHLQIGSPLARCRLPSRDDANPITSPGVDDNEKVSRYAHSEDHEAVFIQARDLVGHPDREFIAEDRRRIGEVDAVLLKIGCGLFRVPLIPFDGMHTCTPCQGDPPASSAGENSRR